MLRSRLHQNQCLRNHFRSFCAKNGSNDRPTDEKQGEKNDEKRSEGKKGFPEPPTTCCMSGCANCVWLEYADRLTEYFKDGGKNAIKEIEKNVEDPNLKAYLMHELKMRSKK